MKTYFAVDSDGTEVCFNSEPERLEVLNIWTVENNITAPDNNDVSLPIGMMTMI